MDMITRIELEDAVANYTKVTNRVLEVAMIVGGIEGTFTLSGDRAHIKGTDWTFEGWRVDLKEPREGMDHLKYRSCVAEFSIPWHKRPETIEHGKPEDDESYYEDHQCVEPLIRQVAFPFEYLFSTGWETECKARLEAKARQMAEFHLEQTEKALEEAEARLEAIRMKRDELREIVES